MSNAISLTIKFFGCLRKYNRGETLSLKAIEGETVLQVKQRLIALLTELIPDFDEHGLINVSAIAYAHEILADDSAILSSGDLFILPPVCGG